MSNPVVEFLQANIGQPMAKSPSPAGRWLNGVLKEVKAGEIIIDFTVREEMTNPMGILHGGLMAAMMDEIIGTAVFSLGLEKFYTTVNLVVDFLASAREGETITAKANIVRQGKTIINVACEVVNAEGKLLARATSNLISTQIKVG